MIFIDTNILLYAICPGRNERAKAEKAREVLRRDDLVLSVQVLQEFYVQATRPARNQPLSHAEAKALIHLWLRFIVVELSVPLLQSALRLKDRYQISYWDAAIVAAASQAGCRELLSEDLNPGQTYDGVRVVNPFDGI
ncbi:MAG: PIN domain-containing protein [Terrimicrobiaceae bacterium]